MIIADSTPHSPLKGSNNNPPPVSYQAASHSGSGQPPAYNHPIIAYQQIPAAPQRSPARRFFTALAVALLVCFLFSLLTASIESIFDGDMGFDYGKDWPFSTTSPPECVDLKRSVESSVPYSYYIGKGTLTLPADAVKQFLLHRGGMSGGHIEFATSSELDANTIKVEVTVRSTYSRSVDLARVCSLSRDDGSAGVGFFTPQHRRAGLSTVTFYVTVTFPASLDSPLHINAFETDVPLFSHHFGELARSVDFSELKLAGSNALIAADSLYARSGHLKTSNSVIRGDFETDKALTLDTSNGHIEVNVELTHASDSEAPELVLKTSNGRIDSNLALFTSPYNKNPGTFKVNTTTSNAAVNNRFTEAPLDSTLQHYARTSNGRVDIVTHPTFEGRFKTETSNARNEVVNKHKEDPSGQGRKRTIWKDWSDRRSTSGTVSWGDSEAAERGTIEVRTSNAQVRLEV